MKPAEPPEMLLMTTTEASKSVRRRMRQWVIFGCVAVAILCWLWLREPRYRGLSLSRWLDTYDAILTGHLTQPGFEETRAALRHFGKNGVSYYAARLAYETPSWQYSILKYLDTAQTGFDKVQKQLSSQGHDYIEARSRRARAATLAFELLGTNGVPAVPDLERIAMSYDYPARSQRAMTALKYIGPSGRAALRRIAMNGAPGPSTEALAVLSPKWAPQSSGQGWGGSNSQSFTLGNNWSNRTSFPRP